MTKVLIVDDDEAMQAFVSTVAKMGDAEVEIAECGESALGLLKVFTPDIIFLDLNMPGMTGWDTVREMRKLPGGDYYKVIAISAHNTAEDRDEAHIAGCDQFIPKPVSPDRILDALASVK